ncbi:hypothetical protein PR048_011071 [Dryococelus australis]|uniref:Uncharacterized protein n=1 Tax=Dryococelus australis TaxID=614101 RepID=A0ABQ9HL30_9NEOP|nr:hypothetical protein PR048_011071 [Dryococelus australis]
MYNAKVTSSSQQAKKTSFRNIVTREYNVGLGTPVTDACLICISLQVSATRERSVQKLRAKDYFFFGILKEEPPRIIQLSFDCQNNLVSPKVTENNRCTPTTTTSFRGHLDQSSQMIESHCLDEWRMSIRKNRNSAMISGNMKHIELIFPVRGGFFFLPSNKVIGNIERFPIKIPVIYDPTHYLQVGIFKFALAKIHIIKQTSLGRVTERVGVINRGKRFGDCTPELVPRDVILNPAKVTDVKNLTGQSFWREVG